MACRPVHLWVHLWSGHSFRKAPSVKVLQNLIDLYCGSVVLSQRLYKTAVFVVHLEHVPEGCIHILVPPANIVHVFG